MTSICRTLLAAAMLLSACGNSPDHTTAPAATSPVNSLEIVDLKTGEGAALAAGQTAVVQYTGWLYETGAPDKKGKQFDSSAGRDPFRFKVGAGDVIAGWDQGAVGMKVGGQRRLIVPADLAYGSAGAGGGVIPPGATLVFDVELVAIEPAPSPSP
jgi:FKBP-type peptidyl-prolyl cis-trans isomerase FkpA